jgi:tetratricopeptide (TPR) repeat protein
MDRFSKVGTILSLLIITLSTPAPAQENVRAVSFTTRRPVAAQEKKRREALELYGIGFWCVANNRLLEAAEHLENGAKLDPEAAPIAKALIPVYLALNRGQDALEACKNYLKLDADDYETWHLYAGQLKNLGQTKEANEAMARAVACLSLQSQPHQLAQMWFDLGVLQENSRDWQEAETAFRKAKRIWSENAKKTLQEGQVNARDLDGQLAQACVHIGQVCREAKRLSQAVNAYAQAQHLIRDKLGDPDRALQFNRTLAEIHIELGELEKARAKLDEYLQSQPSGAEAYELQIKVLTQLGETDAILPALERYARLDHHNVRLQMLLARQYVEEKQWEKAKTKYRELANDNPSPEIYRDLFTLQKDRGEIDGVLSWLDSFLAKAKGKNKEPGDPTAASQARAMITAIGEDGELVSQLIRAAKARLESRQAVDFATWAILAPLAARSQQLSEAEAFYRACLDGAGGASAVIEGDIYFGLIQVLQMQRKYQDVVEICRTGLKESQAVHFGLFYYNLARALAQLGKFDDALAAADKAVELAAEDNRLHLRLDHAWILSLANRHEKAIAECLALLKEAAKPEDRRQIRYYLSGFYTAAHDLPKAEEILRLIIQDFPDDAGAHNDLGYLMADQGKNLPEAEELIRKAIALDREQKRKETKVGLNDDKDNAAFVDSLGWVLFRRGRFEEAKQELERALKLPEQNDVGADDPVIWDHLGDVYFRLDDKVKARTLWEKAVKLYEEEKRRKLDDQYKALKHKLKVMDSP